MGRHSDGWTSSCALAPLYMLLFEAYRLRRFMRDKEHRCH